jgi:FkbM family methyltransferase
MLKQLLQPGSSFIDVGANIDYISLPASKYWPAAKIISLEPVAGSSREFFENITLNCCKNIEA